MTDNHHEYDDLTIIKGIGTNRAQWLRHSLDIQTLRDLSTMSPETIEARLKAEGFIASRAKIESWIEQARQILAEMAQENMPKRAPSAQGAASGQSAAPDAWKSLASFVVEYQTRRLPDGTEERRSTVHHIESDQEMSWNTPIDPALAAWMQTQVDSAARKTQAKESVQPQEVIIASAEPAQEANTLTAPAGSESANQLEITEIKAFQPTQTMRYAGGSRTGQPFLGSLNSGETFALEASFQLAEAISGEKGEITAQFYAYHTQSGSLTNLGTTRPSPLQADRQIQRVVLPGARLDKGLYRLRVYGKLQSEAPATGYLEVPYVQVT